MFYNLTMKKETLINFRVSSDLKESFREVIAREGYGISMVLEASMKDIVKRGHVPLNLRPYLPNVQNKTTNLPYIKKCLDEILNSKLGDKVNKVSIFGSFARGEDTPESDVDLLIEANEGFGLFELVGIGDELESRLGRKVDLVTKKGLSKEMIQQIEREKIVIFEKTEI